MNKIATAFLSVFLVVAMSACSQTVKKSAWDMTTLERIEAADNVYQAMACYDYKAESSTNTSPAQYGHDEWVALYQKILDLCFKEQQINGTYYYDSGTSQGIEDAVYIYAKDNETLYIVPQDAVDGDDLEQIPNIENASDYAYKIPPSSDVDSFDVHHSLKLANEECYARITLTKASNNEETAIKIPWSPKGAIEIKNENVPDYLAKKYPEKTKYIKTTRTYYSDKSTMEEKNEEQEQERAEKAQEKLEKKQKEAEEKAQKQGIRNSEPKVGMTADEVKMSRWGSPDKINKTEYSWGVKEQWVYEGKGYVYLKNGVVEAVQSTK